MKELGFKDLQTKISDSDFKDIIDYLKKVTIRYQNNLPDSIPEERLIEIAESAQDADFSDDLFVNLIKDTNIENNLESVFVLTQNLFSFLWKNKTNSSLNKDFVDYIFSQDSPYSNIEVILKNIEGFLKEIALLTCEKSHQKKIDSLMLEGLIDLENKVSGEKPLVNGGVKHVKDIATTLRIYRNKNIHDDQKLKYFIPQDRKGNSTRIIVRDSVACFVLMVVWNRFDDVYDAIMSHDMSSTGVEQKEMEEYQKRLKDDQMKLLNGIYNIKTIDDSGFRSISHVSLKSFNNGNYNIDEESHILLAGESGTGKSILVAEMVYKDCLSWQQNKKEEHHMPIKIELKYFTEEYSNNFFGFIVNEVKKRLDLSNEQSELIRTDYIRNYLRTLFNNGKITLYVDGLNEMNAKLGEIRDDAIRGLIQLSEDYKKCRFIVTSRIKDMDLDEGEGTIGRFKRFDLQPLDERQVNKQIENYLKLTDVKRFKHRAKVIGDRIIRNKIEDLANNPLQLILIIKFFENNKGSKRASLIATNRSQLLHSLAQHITKEVNFKNPGDDSKDKINQQILKLLCKIAEKQFVEKDNRDLDLSVICSECNNIMDKSLHYSLTIEKLLHIAVTYGILELKDNGYNFRHDSWREHFQAYNIVQELVKVKEAGMSSESIVKTITHETNGFKARESMDFLRHIFEILEIVSFVEKREKLRKAISIKEKNMERVQAQLSLLEDDSELQNYLNNNYEYENELNLIAKENGLKKCKDNLQQIQKSMAEMQQKHHDDTMFDCSFVYNFAMNIMQLKSGLKILSYATATLESFENEASNPKEVVQQEVKSLLTKYERQHPTGIIWSTIPHLKQQIDSELKPLFECAVISGNGDLISVLFKTYWLDIWHNNKEKKDTQRLLSVLPAVMMEKSENQMALFDQMFYAYQKLCLMGEINRGERMERLMMRLITKMGDSEVISIIMKMINQNEQDDPIASAQKRRIGAKALLGLKDADLMFKILKEIPELEAYKFNTTIHINTLNNLFEKFDDLRMQSFIVGNHFQDVTHEGLLETLAHNTLDHLKVLAFVLYRYDRLYEDCKKTFQEYLESEQAQDTLSKHHELSDLLSLDNLPIIYKDKYDIVNYETDATTGLYMTRCIKYTMFSATVEEDEYVYMMAISRPPQIDIASYDIKFGSTSNKLLIKAGNYTKKEELIQNRKILLLEIRDTHSLMISHEGVFEFLQNDQAVPVGYSKLRDVIWLNHPERYHSSICDKLIQECDCYEDFKDLFYFCKEKSQLGKLLNAFFKTCMLNAPIRNWDLGKIELCEVLAANQANVRVFSPSKSGILNPYSRTHFNKSIYCKGAILLDCFLKFLTDYEKGSESLTRWFFILEKNGSLSSINYNKILNIENHHLFGFIDGYVKNTSDKCQIALSAESYRDDNSQALFTCDNKCLGQFNENDHVSFFPSLEITKNGEMLKAELVEKIEKENDYATE